MLEPVTKAILKGFIFALVAFIVYFFIPFFIYNLVLGFFMDAAILYFGIYLFGPPEAQFFTSLLLSYSPGLPLLNINFGTVILLGLPVSVAAFFLGFFKSETVGHGLSGLATQIFFGIWFLLGVGTLGVTSFFQNASIPLRYVLTPSFPYISPVYLNYTAPWILNIQGIINLGAAIILLVGLIYLVDLGIGINNNDYWRYWGK
nr:hypothetical protein [Candidatus Freyarchaeota archaeon]